MTVYDITNIEHCDVEEFGNPATMFRIKAHEGWWIHWRNEDPVMNLIYKKTIIPRVNSDFSQITVVHESELPPDANLCAEVSEKEKARIAAYHI